MFRKIVVLFVAALLILTSGCTKSDVKEVTANEDFDLFCDRLIQELIGLDNPNFNQLIIYPQDLGYSKEKIVWPKYGLEEGLAFNDKCDKAYTELLTYDSEKLSIDQKETYDVLSSVLKPTSSEYVEAFYYLANNPLGTYSGILGDIPLQFYYFNLNDQMDVTNYIGLMETLNDLALNLLDYEKERQQKGYGMTPEEVAMTIDDLERTLEAADYSFVVDSFKERIADSGLEEITQKAYVTQVEADMQEALFAFYETIYEGLKTLDVKQESDVSLYDLKYGREYYAELVKSYTGLSISEYEDYLSELIVKQAQDFIAIYDEDIDYFTPIYNSLDPNTVLAYLKAAIEADFPPIGEVDYQIISAPQALVSLLGSTVAFYVVAPVDKADQRQEMTLVGDYTDSAFLTLAHEGFPGHLYQHVFDNTYNDTPYIISFLDLAGYTEGYANYVERYCVKYAQNPSLARLSELANSYSTLVLLMCDLNMHYYGEDTSSLIADLIGVAEDSAILSPVIKQLQFAPGLFIPYYGSGFLFDDLRDELEETIGYEVSDLEFHEAILSHGPMPLEVLKDYVINDFIES